MPTFGRGRHGVPARTGEGTYGLCGAVGPAAWLGRISFSLLVKPGRLAGASIAPGKHVVLRRSADPSQRGGIDDCRVPKTRADQITLAPLAQRPGNRCPGHAHPAREISLRQRNRQGHAPLRHFAAALTELQHEAGETLGTGALHTVAQIVACLADALRYHVPVRAGGRRISVEE